MKRFISLAFILLSFNISFAQIQQGIVKTRGRVVNGKVVSGMRLTGATVTLNFGNPLVSGNNGTFSFNVPSGKNYSLVAAKKQGYTLADPEFTHRSFSYSAKNPFYVVLEDEAQRQADINAAIRKVRRTLNAQLEKREDEILLLKQQKLISEKEYQEKLTSLYDSQSKNDELVGKMAEQYVAIDYDQLDEFNRQVQLYIEEGELIKADSLLNTRGNIDDLAKELDSMDKIIKEDKDIIDRRLKNHEKIVALKAQKLNEFASNCFSRHEICKLKHNNDSAAYWLELRASKDADNVIWQIEAGDFIREYVADTEKAFPYYLRACDKAKQLYGEYHSLVACCYNNIGRCYRNGTTAFECFQAISYFKKAVDVYTHLYGSDNADIATNLSNIGTAYKLLAFITNEELNTENTDNEDSQYNLTYYDYALDYSYQAMRLRLKLYGEMNPDVATSYNNIGCIYGDIYKKTQEEDADSLHLSYISKALEIRSTVYEDAHPDVGNSYGNIGAYYANHGKDSLALSYLHKALEVYKSCYGEQHRHLILLYGDIGYIHEKMENYSEALKYYDCKKNILVGIYGADSWLLYPTYEQISRCFYYDEEYSSALQYSLKFKDIVQKEYEYDSDTWQVDLARAYWLTAMNYMGLDDQKTALNYIDNAIALAEENVYYQTKGIILMQQNKQKEAIAIWKRILEFTNHDMDLWDGELAAILYEAGLINETGEPIKQ